MWNRKFVIATESLCRESWRRRLTRFRSVFHTRTSGKLRWNWSGSIWTLLLHLKLMDPGITHLRLRQRTLTWWRWFSVARWRLVFNLDGRCSFLSWLHIYRFLFWFLGRVRNLIAVFFGVYLFSLYMEKWNVATAVGRDCNYIGKVLWNQEFFIVVMNCHPCDVGLWWIFCYC